MFSIFLLWKLSENLGYNWQFYRIGKYIIEKSNSGYQPGVLLRGLIVTVEISAISLVLSFIIGLTSSLFRVSGSAVLNMVSVFYIETIRNTPLLIQIFFNYFVLSPIFDISPYVTAILTLSLFEGAYASEIIRGGLNSIHFGQYEAARSLGLTSFQMYRFVVLPQALRNVAPTLASQAISLVKDSALVSTISVYELTLYGQAIVSETFLSFEVWFTVAAIYLIINIILSICIKIFSKKVKRGAV